MKKLWMLLLGAALTSTFVACEKEDKDKIVTPKTEVPDELVGNWSAGDFNINEFFTYNGTSQPDATEMVAYKIAKDGTAEQYIYYRFTDGSGKQTLTHRKGSVTYDESTSTLQFCPSEGTIRNFTGSNKEEGNIAKDGLYPTYAPRYRDVSVETFEQHLFLVGITDQNSQIEFLKGSW